MKVVVITQEDSFTVPKNIQKLIDLGFVEMQKVVNINSKHSLVNQKELFIKGFGLIQSAKMAFAMGYEKIWNILDSLTGYKLPISPRSLKAVAKKNKVEYAEISNPNDSKFLKELRGLAPDVVVSYSAPLIFREELLNIPKNGCINLHCSYLPNYAGVMPSFWVLYHKEKTTGCSVHYMDTKIDNGKLLEQEVVEIKEKDSMYDIIKRTKEVGGNLMCDVLLAIKNGKVVQKDNEVSKEKYFSWPTVEDFKDFRKKGGRLI